jgi:hypothetical protein
VPLRSGLPEEVQMKTTYLESPLVRIPMLILLLAICALVIVALLPPRPISAQGGRGVTLKVKDGHPDTLPADGQSQTVLVVDMDPSASCWTPSWWHQPVDISGEFWMKAATSSGSVSPGSSKVASFPTEVTLTASETPGQAEVTVELSYCPPGGVGLFGECSVMPEVDTDGDGIPDTIVAWVDAHPVCTAQAAIGIDEPPAAEDVDDEEKEDLVVYIGLVPEPPVAGASLIFAADVEGQRPGETLTYEWFLDAEYVGDGPTFTWAEAAVGDHIVRVIARGQGEGREAEERRNFSVLEDVSQVPDDVEAGFHIANLGCGADITSDETLACTVNLSRDRDDIGPLTVVWLIDGATAASQSAPGNSASWGLDRPAPGEHKVEVRVTDPQTNSTRVASTTVQVRAGENPMIPPGVQLGAAAGTLVAVGTWLWWEWSRGRKAVVPATAPPVAGQGWEDWAKDAITETSTAQKVVQEVTPTRQQMEEQRPAEPPEPPGLDGLEPLRSALDTRRLMANGRQERDADAVDRQQMEGEQPAEPPEPPGLDGLELLRSLQEIDEARRLMRRGRRERDADAMDRAIAKQPEDWSYRLSRLALAIERSDLEAADVHNAKLVDLLRLVSRKGPLLQFANQAIRELEAVRSRAARTTIFRLSPDAKRCLYDYLATCYRFRSTVTGSPEDHQAHLDYRRLIRQLDSDRSR